MAGFVAIDTRFHFHAENQLERIGGPDISMASIAGHLLRRVPGVAEEYKVRQRVERFLGRDNGVRRYLAMAEQAL
jgi:hypothetical protein